MPDDALERARLAYTAYALMSPSDAKAAVLKSIQAEVKLRAQPLQTRRWNFIRSSLSSNTSA